jgi:hypothetical protein
VTTNRECDALSRHLVGRPCPADVADRYLRAIRELDLRLTPVESVIWNVSCGFGPLLACLDAGVALWNRHGTIRHRLLVMFALLEASTANTDRFLFSPRSVAAHAGSLIRFLVAPVAMIVGTPLAVLCLVGGRKQG